MRMAGCGMRFVDHIWRRPLVCTEWQPTMKPSNDPQRSLLWIRWSKAMGRTWVWGNGPFSVLHVPWSKTAKWSFWMKQRGIPKAISYHTLIIIIISASVDLETDGKIQRTIQELRGRTLLTIARKYVIAPKFVKLTRRRSSQDNHFLWPDPCPRCWYNRCESFAVVSYFCGVWSNHTM